MSAIDLETAKTMLDLWIAAEKAVASSQEYRIGQKSLTRADAKVITDKINYWRREVSRLESGTSGIICQMVVPVDC